jgi:hypothetical protein
MTTLIVGAPTYHDRMTNTERTTAEYGWFPMPDGAAWSLFEHITDADYTDPERIAANYERALESARRNLAFKRERERRFADYRRTHPLAS